MTARQFLCAVIAVGVAAGIYLGLGPVIGKETASWACILAAAPVALAGFFHYNGMTLDRFLWAVVKSEILFAGGRHVASENFYSNLLRRKGGQDFD